MSDVLPDISKEALAAENAALDSTDDIKVDIIDDTPPEDRGRKPLPKEVVEELDNDPLDEYSEKVQNRIKQMKKVWHDERREKEAASREREEALALARKALEENKFLKQRIGVGEKAFIHEATRAVNQDIQIAKDKLRQAQESGDLDKIIEAQEAFTDAKLRSKEVEKFKPTLQDNSSSVQNQKQPSEPEQAKVDPKAEAWRQRNTWFGPNEEMTSLALGLHHKLVRMGVDTQSDDYYKRLDTEMRKRFPEEFEDVTQNEEKAEKPAPRKASTVVAPATRATSPRQVRLTSTEAAIAKRLGLTPEAYAREKMKLENING